MLYQYIVLPRGLSYSSVFSVKPEPVTTLWYMLHEIPDHRRGQGKRHDLPTILILAILSLCSGHLSYLAMQEWCENYQDRLDELVPFLARHMPNAATFHRVFANLDVLALEEVFGRWIQTVVPVQKGEGVALDGKTLHGTGIHIVAAFAHIAKAVLFEEATDIKGKELVVGPRVLKHITIRDHVVTADALFAQTGLCNQIVLDHGGYVIRVKGNQPTLEEHIRLFFKDPPFKAVIKTNTTMDHWKGRRERREVRVSSDTQLLSYLKWPGLTHVWLMKKTVTEKGKTTIEESVGIAGLPGDILRERDDALAIAEYIRGHWSIENRLHRQRDVQFSEDKGTIRKAHAPQVMAALRNLVTGIFHRGTVRNFKSAMRRFGARPEELFDFLGLTAMASQQVM